MLFRTVSRFDNFRKKTKTENKIFYLEGLLKSISTLTDFCLKRQNKVGKIVKKSKFHFFKIHPKMDLDNL